MQLNWKIQTATFMIVTPQMALVWLNHHNGYNRDMRPTVVAQYVKDIEAGRWQQNGEPIQFDVTGNLINGQHRLQAIWDTQKPMEILVVTGLSPDVRMTVDIQSKRAVKDAFDLSGNGTLLAGSVLKTTAAGMWARMMHGMSQRKGSETRPELVAFAERYHAGGTFALEQFGKHRRVRHVCVAPVMAAVARASYHVSKDLLARFVEVLCTGFQRSPDDKTVIVLREFLASRPKGNSNVQPELYAKTCRAIQAYSRGEHISRLYAPTEDLFPLPARPDAHAAPRLVGVADGVA